MNVFDDSKDLVAFSEDSALIAPKIREQTGQSFRHLRLASVLQKDLNLILANIQSEDDILRPLRFSITRIHYMSHLRYAKVYLEGEKISLILKQIKLLLPKIRHQLHKVFRARIVPDLSFFHDDTWEKEKEIQRLIAEVMKKEKDSLDL